MGFTSFNDTRRNDPRRNGRDEMTHGEMPGDEITRDEMTDDEITWSHVGSMQHFSAGYCWFSRPTIKSLLTRLAKLGNGLFFFSEYNP
jgi:hypothetical protein